MRIMDVRFLAVLSLLSLLWGLVYQDALMGMEAIWSRSDTFAHGYFIFPITVWLIWRDKTYLLASTVQPSLIALPLLAISLFVGLFAYAADINVLRQLSAITSFIFMLWLLIGNKFAWRYKFPLAYLLFLVPMGENLIPWLQDVTAWFTVAFIKLNGIPVYVDGLYIQIPTGMFEVAVACSGIRYLIASAAVGALYAYLTYNKFHKQVIFFIFALTLPILANGIRAYGIVAIAYYSDMQYATGADHLVYGWVFFGFIIMLMFWVGGFFADNPDNVLSDYVSSKSIHPTQNFLIILMCASGFVVTFFLIKAIPLTYLGEQQIKSDNAATSTWGIDFVDAKSFTFRINQQGVEFYHAIYANKQDRGELISSKSKLHNLDDWTVISTKLISIDEKPYEIIHLRSISGQARSYMFQFRVGDFYTVNANKAKLAQAWNSLTRQSDYSEVIAISVTGFSDLSSANRKLKESFNPLNYKANLLEK